MSRARRILLTTFGSLGDLNPFLALAIELKRRGYEALVGSIDLHRPFVEKAGIEFRHVRTGVWENPDPNLIARLFHPRKGPKTLIADMVMPALRTAYEDTLTAAEVSSCWWRIRSRSPREPLPVCWDCSGYPY